MNITNVQEACIAGRSYEERGGSSLVLSANRGDEEPGRIVRLAQVVGYICAKKASLLRCIAKLHDHKGCLTVTWSATLPPTDEAIELLLCAWESDIGDGCRDSVQIIDQNSERVYFES